MAYPGTLTFDLSEIVAELEISNQKFIPLTPLRTGMQVHDLVLKKEYINKSNLLNNRETNGSVFLRQIGGKPLVLSFYSPEWQDHGLAHLKHLNNLNREVKAFDSNLLIVCPGEPDARLEEAIWDNSLLLNFYFDRDNTIAQKFGLFSDADPAWNKYPGIEVNVPLLATYALDQSDRVIFDFVDHQLRGPVFSKQLLQAIQMSHLSVSNKLSA